MADMTPLLIAVMAFGCVSIIIFIVGRYVTSQATNAPEASHPGIDVAECWII